MWKSLADCVKSDLANGIPLKQQAVIARKGVSVADAAKALQEAGIPTLYVGELMERPEVKDILAVIQLVVERSPRALLRVGEFATPRMRKSDVQATLLSVANDGSQQRLGWLNLSSLPLSPQGQDSRRDLEKKLRGFAWSTRPWDFMCELLLERRFLLVDVVDDSLPGHLRRLAQWQFVYMARAGDGDRKRSTLFRLLNRLRLRQQIRDVYIDRELPPETNGLEGVRVMTVHASKGLEFQAVHLVGVNGKDFSGADDRESLLPPEAIGSNPTQHAHESEVEAHNLLYVAVSRAKNALTIYEANKEYPFKSVDALEAAVQQRVLVARLGPSLGIVPARVPAAPTTGAGKGVGNDEFLAYDRCPRQYFYRFGLEMGQELSPNPSLQARGLVKRTLKSLAAGGRYDQLAIVFEDGWALARLPDSAADPQLWAQAWSAAEHGAAFLASVNGRFLEAAADVRGLSVGLPWGVAVKAPGGQFLHCVDFYSGSKKYQGRQENILGQLMSLTTTPNAVVGAQLFDLSRRTSRDVQTVKVYDRSTVATRASGLASGVFLPVEGSFPCSRCAYSYVCPSLPSA